MKPELLGFREIPTKSPYEKKRYTGPATIVYYKTGKILVQGKQAEKYRELLKIKTGKEAKEKTKTLKTKKEYIETKKVSGTIIGSDETLKGDTFGGIVVAGFKADKKVREELKIICVMDSKKLDDHKISLIAKIISEKFPKNYHVISLKPKEYNEQTSQKSVTNLLDRLHREVNQALKTIDSTHIVDKYPGCKAGDIQIERAESKYLEVAAASILARDAGLKQLAELSKKAGMHIPKGSTHVLGALKKLKEKKLSPKEFVKMNFSNVKVVF